MQVFKDLNNIRRTPADYGATWLSEERIVELGLMPVASDYQTPYQVPTDKEKIIALDAVYQPQFAELAKSLGLATLDGNQTVIDGIKADYATLKAEYQTKVEAINNG